MAENASSFYNGDMITRCNGKGRRSDGTKTDKVVDFRDGLQRADIDHYARLHQPGGRKTAGYASVIRMVLTEADEDKKGGKPAHPSTTVRVNLEPHVPAMLLEVCKKTFGEQVLMDGGPMAEAVRQTTKIDAICGVLKGLITGLSKHIVFLAKDQGKPFSRESLTDLSHGLKEGMAGCKSSHLLPEGPIPVKSGIRYTYTQDKVDVYNGKDGVAPVSRLTITREPFRTKDGICEEARYPWTIKVTNGTAPFRETASGSTTFNGSQMTDVTEVFIQVSDADLFRMMNSVVKYIDCWEKAMCIPGVIAGVKKKEERYAQQWDQTL